VRRLLLVRHAPTEATRELAFPLDEPLDERGREQAAQLAERLPKGCEAVSSPALRCRETARAAGLEAVADPALAECDFGTWAGRSLAEVDAEDPAGARAWITDPDSSPHGGESLTAFAARIAVWLDDQTQAEGRAVAVTHGGVVKGALVHALGAPLTAFWQLDVAPLAVTELHAHDGRWTIARMNCGAA
jgi:broad specificity phosphatase PhoE